MTKDTDFLSTRTVAVAQELHEMIGGMSLPETMPFEKVKHHKTMDCFYRKIGHRRPKKGEWYVSGGIPMAYLTSTDLSTAYLIVRPTHLVRQVTRFERGDPIL